MSEIDHRIGQGLEGIVQLTEAIEAKQQSAELVFPSEHSFNRLKSFLKYRRIEQPGQFNALYCQWPGAVRFVKRHLHEGPL
jgi:hypothetical protein